MSQGHKTVYLTPSFSQQVLISFSAPETDEPHVKFHATLLLSALAEYIKQVAQLPCLY